MNVTKPTEKESHDNKGFILSNTEMDKSILQKAFDDTAYERNKRDEYSSNLNISKKRNSISVQPENAFRNRRQKDKAIWENAFPQIFDNFRHFQLLENENLNSSDGSQMSSIDFIKSAYGEVKGGHRRSRNRLLSDSIIAQPSSRSPQESDEIEDQSVIITEGSPSSTNTTITKL